jgi:glycosyltransferase involved in cell wall biosynthesis
VQPFKDAKQMDSIKLSILIPTLVQRIDMYNSLLEALHKQVTNEVEILSHSDPFMSIGEKRNELLNNAKGEYVCFIDDDDEISENYIKNLLEGISKDVDCCSLRGIITFDYDSPKYFEHSIKYNEYKTTDNPITYERYPNHLNCIKASIAKQFKFPEINHGEDTDWATQIHKSGLIKSEHYINETMYYYKFITNK